MEVIWKFKVLPVQKFSITMPKDAKILSAHEQHGAFQVWAHVTGKTATHLEWEDREFELIGTGNEMNPVKKGKQRKFITTILKRGGDFVFHLFEIVDVPR